MMIFVTMSINLSSGKNPNVTLRYILRKAMMLKLLTLSIILGISACPASDHPLDALEIKRIQTAITSLNQDSPFVFFNLTLSQEESVTLNKIKVNCDKEYHNFGNLEALHNEVTAYIKSLGNEEEKTIETVSKTIQRIVGDCIQASGKEKTAWITLRASQPNPLFDLARWHTDGYYYQPYCDQYKFAFTLKGPGTKFYKLPKQMRGEFDALQEEENRQALASKLTDPQLLMQSKTGEGAVFVVGSDDAAVHSEPPIKEKRLFMSILPGSKEQIAEWKKNGFKEY
jgi:hypothetical protein